MKMLVTSQSSAIGGVERRLLSEIRVFKRLAWEVSVAVPRVAGDAAWREEIVRSGAEMLRWNPYKSIERNQYGTAVGILARFNSSVVKRLDPDLAYVPLTWTRVGMSRVAQLSRLGIPIVLGLHCSYPSEKIPLEVRSEIGKALGSVVGAYAVSSSAKHGFLSNYEQESSHFAIDIIPNGIDCERFSLGGEGSLDRKDSARNAGRPFVIVFCGRIEEMKRPVMAVQVLSALRQKGMDARLVFVGEGPMLSFLKDLVTSSRLTPSVDFLGFVGDTSEVYRKADLYLSTSLSEGFPLAASEALASGVPIAVPDIEVFQECFGGCGAASFIGSSDPEEWASKIFDLSYSLAAQGAAISLSARKFAEEFLDSAVMEKRLSVFYEKMRAMARSKALVRIDGARS